MIIRINTSFEQNDEPVRLSKIPGQLIGLVIYVIRLAIDVFLSGVDVAGRVIRPSLPIKPDVQRVNTQDATNDNLISALSAHSITITPGELVIDFEEGEHGETIMLVHTLDKDASNMEKLTRDQTKRLKLIRQILGHDEPSTKGENDA
jgi:multicomponent Na+:H+ antiporter subunit E